MRWNISEEEHVLNHSDGQEVTLFLDERTNGFTRWFSFESPGAPPVASEEVGLFDSRTACLDDAVASFDGYGEPEIASWLRGLVGEH